MIGFSSMDLAVRHTDIDSDDDFDSNPKTTVTENHVQCLIERRDSVENTVEGVGYSSNLTVIVHVKKPIKPNVVVGDKFNYGSSEYTVTTIDDGIMPQNKVSKVPYIWRFRGEVLKGR
jgi:hypothetical protein